MIASGPDSKNSTVGCTADLENSGGGFFFVFTDQGVNTNLRLSAVQGIYPGDPVSSDIFRFSPHLLLPFFHGGRPFVAHRFWTDTFWTDTGK